MKNLYIVRGLPGSGKTTLGNAIACAYCFSADDFFYDEDNSYNFNAGLLKQAHESCKKNVELAMQYKAEDIAVANTFTRESEMADYMALAEKYGYTVHSIIVENRHGNTSVHNVPEGTIQKMKNRFEVKL